MVVEEIVRVLENKYTKQKSVTIPKRMDIEKGDYVRVRKVKGDDDE